MRLSVLLFPLLLATAAAADCPDAPETGDQRADLHSQLLRAPDETSARIIANGLWQLWLTAPDARAQDLLDRGMARREAYDYAAAEELLDQLIGYCPNYDEGYNQRAFVRFLRGDFDGSLADLAVVLQTNPYHFGALSGKALTLMQQGQVDAAQAVLRQAIRVHPFLRERAYLTKTEDDPI